MPYIYHSYPYSGYKGVKDMKKLLLLLIIAGIGIYFYNENVKSEVNNTAKSFLSPSNRDKYGLLSSDYDRNGWAKVNGKWVSNPRSSAYVRYADTQIIATSSSIISNMDVRNNSAAKIYRNFSSLEEAYPLLERVARDLEYSDIPALNNSFKRYNSLSYNHYYEVDGMRFYSNQALLDHKIQKAKSWGSRNDQNNDGVINCADYAELFYKYASEAGYHVQYISNSNLNHAFNSINVNGTWRAIEPQSAESGLGKSPLVSVRWTNYNPSFDKVRKEN
jgi:hypothetical protein